MTKRPPAAIRARNDHFSPGFSLVELLVVIAIVGVLVSLLLPAVQAARESARRIQCVNNLRQLAIAVLNYESAHQALPPSGIVERKEKEYGETSYSVFDQRSGKMMSWAVVLLPYFEQDALYDLFAMDQSILAQSNEPQETPLEMLLCPSDLSRGRYYSDPEYTNGKRFAKGNYAAYVSPHHIDMQLEYPGALIFTGQSLRRIEDGTSNTIVFSEVRTLDITRDERGVWALPWAGASVLSFDMHHWCSARPAGCYKSPQVCPGERHYRPDPCSLGVTQLPNTIVVVDTLHYCPSGGSQENQSLLEGMPCGKWNGKIGTRGYYSAAPRSLHVGGVNVAYLDGHVDFLPDEIDEFSMAYLISINDGQIDK